MKQEKKGTFIVPFQVGRQSSSQDNEISRGASNLYPNFLVNKHTGLSPYL